VNDYDVIAIGGCARAYAESHGFLSVHSDGERLTSADALGPEEGE
jgi:hypothetical protein